MCFKEYRRTSPAHLAAAGVHDEAAVELYPGPYVPGGYMGHAALAAHARVVEGAVLEDAGAVIAPVPVGAVVRGENASLSDRLL